MRVEAARPGPHASARTEPISAYRRPVIPSLQTGAAPETHLFTAIEPSILYFGTPVVLITTTNPDGAPNLAPISSAWALGHTLVLGLGSDGQTVANLRERPELVVNVPSPGMWEQVERLAPLTGRSPVPASKPHGMRFEADKFAAAGVTSMPSATVAPPRVAECPLQLEGSAISITPGQAGGFVIVEVAVSMVHAATDIVVPGTNHIDPATWSPLIYNFRHYFGLSDQLGHSYRSDTPTTTRK
ncbi:flavin reductase family protein [Agromyces aurantiacus]|uniref:Flavin reductase family protein n=1 Tax=Agromyces aurantiacus TaxID=165814 RepID=A0ABV9R655_9MICO|nr:flavin reductase family protein [Agromyces aurantiacus]MBM7503478.1 flavin reductase (DIM6/NTAB) family NADH-FMN oxidoreductase RutF [Agromyces aurantiacus]